LDRRKRFERAANEDRQRGTMEKPKRRPFIGRKRLATQRPKPGVYRHYKGKHYEVIETALHVETLQAFVVYRSLYGEGNLWIRARSEFLGKVEVDGVKQPRFEAVEDPADGLD
jgi:hypothetical protein